MKRKIISLIGLLAFSLIIISFPASTLGQGPSGFSPEEPHYTHSTLTYNIDEDLAVNAQLDFSLEGEEDMNYEVSRTVPTSEVTDIQVQSSPEGRVDHTVEHTSDKTTIQIDFSIDSGEHLSYTISYKGQGLVSQKGPKNQLKTSLGRVEVGFHDDLEVVVRGPPEAELFTYDPEEVTVSGENISYQTSLDSGSSFEGIRATWYSSPAYYKFALTEIFKNETDKEVKNVKYDIALFNRSNSWQFSALLPPLPSSLQSIYLDAENNWRAILKVDSLSPGETKEFRINLLSQVILHDPNLDETQVGSLSEVPSGLDPYLKSAEKWQSDSSTIQQLAQTVRGEEKNSYLVAKTINRFVIDQLKYEIQEGRLGALEAYQIGKGDCSEYTDLSIALARAVDLPARASYGWGYQENKPVPHAWPEFYLPNVGWQPADPTWADTGGRIRPGGIPTRGPPSKGRKFAPIPSGSPESYLCRLDTVHIQRNLAWLDSSESYGEYTYQDAAPSIGENLDAEILSEAEAAGEFVSAAQLNFTQASQLIGGEENLDSEFNKAENYLNQAENTGSLQQRIGLSQKSLEYSGKIIKSEGEPSKSEENFLEIPDVSIKLVIAIIVVVCVVLGAGYGLKKKSESPKYRR